MKQCSCRSQQKGLSHQKTNKKEWLSLTWVGGGMKSLQAESQLHQERIERNSCRGAVLAFISAAFPLTEESIEGTINIYGESRDGLHQEAGSFSDLLWHTCHALSYLLHFHPFHVRLRIFQSMLPFSMLLIVSTCELGGTTSSFTFSATLRIAWLDQGPSNAAFWFHSSSDKDTWTSQSRL